jgi:hypothetical protein
MCLVLPLGTICLDTEPGWLSTAGSAVLLPVLEGAWGVNPLRAVELTGNGPDLRRYRDKESSWQRHWHFNEVEQPDRAGIADFRRQGEVSAVDGGVPTLKRFAEYAN